MFNYLIFFFHWLYFKKPFNSQYYIKNKKNKSEILGIFKKQVLYALCLI